MRKFWQSLAESDRQALKLAAGALFITLVYLLWVQPQEEMLQQARDRYDASEAQHARLQAQFSEAERLGPVTDGAEQRGDLEAEVQNALRRQGLQQQLTRWSPAGNDRLRLHFEQVPFDKLVALLVELQQQGVGLTQMQTGALDDPGMVRAEISLSR